MTLLEDLQRKKFDGVAEEDCIRILEKTRWGGAVRCPTCGNQNISRFQTKGKTGKARHLYQCLQKTCRYQFSATTGTIFHDSHLPLKQWFTAFALLAESKDISANQLRHALGVQYKTAAHVLRRVREAIQKDSIEVAESSVATQPAPAQKPAAPRKRPVLTITRRATGAGPGLPPQEAVRISGSAARQRTDNTASAPSGPPAQPPSGSAPGTTFDNMLNMFVSLAQITFRPPLSFVNYLTNKIST